MINNSIDIEKEQEIMRQKIKTINETGIYDQVYDVLFKIGNDKIRANSESNIALMGRVKNSESACKKIARQGLPASEIYDLIAFMFVVDLPEQYAEAKKNLKEGIPAISFIHDFDGNLPENNGYSSFHTGMDLDKLIENVKLEELKGVSVEAQLKTYGMYIAQEVTHDSIYKNPSLSREDKNKLQTIMFPMIEKIVNIQKYQECLDSAFDEKKMEEYRQRILSEEQEILKLKMNHKEFINSNAEQVQDVLNEFILVQYMEKIKNDPLLAMENINKEQVKNNCKKAIKVLSNPNYQLSMSSSKPTGFGMIDDIYNKIMNSSIKEIQEISLEENQHETTPKLLEGAVEFSKKEVTSSDIRTMVNTVKSKAKEKETSEMENHIKNNGEER